MSCFASIGRELDELNRATEAEFLAIGKRLQEISRQARDIAAMSGRTASLLDGEEFSASIDGLRRVVASVEGLERAGGMSRETLETMLSRITQCMKLLRGFERLVLTLKVLALHTRIESARVQDRNSDFSALGDDVARLAVDIQEKSESILDGSASMQVLVRQTLGSLKDLDSAQQARTASLVRETTEGLDTLTRNHAESATVAAGVASRYETVCKRIGDVVRSLQFQDITRQQIEHVTEALDDANQRLTGNPPDDIVAAAVEVAVLQAAQLRNSRETLVGAVKRILDDLHLVARQVREISELPAKLAGSAEQEGGSFLDATREKLSAVARDLDQYSRSSSEVRHALDDVLPGIEKMAGAANQIEAIGFHLGLVALNAQVKTAQIGAAGAALGVLAGGIQELTGDTSGRTGEVAQQLRSLDGDAQRLRSSGITGGENGIGLDSLAGEIGERVAKISQLDQTISGSLNELTVTGTSLSEDLEAACGTVQSHQKAEEVFDRVLELLEVEIERLRKRLPAGYLPSANAAGTEWQKARYTMQSERDVHSTIAASGAEMQPPADEAAKEAVAAESQSDDGLGDNVELF